MRVRLTREGLRFVALLGLVSFAAYNTGNNLIFLVLSVGVAAMAVALVSGVLSLRGLSVAALPPSDVYAGVPFVERLRLDNASALANAYGLSVDGGAVQVGLLRRGSEARCGLTRLFPRRGLHPGPPVVVSTRFPLGLFRVERRFELPRRILVYPETKPVDGSALSKIRGPGASTGGAPGQGDELFRLRDYESGDPVHLIHWRTTAKVGRLMVRDLGDAPENRIALAYHPVAEAGFERVVVATASIARHLSEAGTSFRFISPDAGLPPGTGRQHLRAVLALLATARTLSSVPSSVGARLERARASGESPVVVAAEGAPLLATGNGALRIVTPDRVLLGKRVA